MHINYIWYETHTVNTVQPLYMTAHSSCLFLCDHTHYIDDVTHTLYDITYIYMCHMYIWQNMHCMWHLTHSLWHHNTLFMTSNYYIPPHTVISDSTSTVSLSSNPDYRSYNPHFMYDNTATIVKTPSSLQGCDPFQYQTVLITIALQ